MMMEKESAATVVGNFQITKSMPNQSQLVITGYLFDKDDEVEIDRRLDNLMARANRQFHIAGLEKLESDRKMSIANLEKIREIYARLVEKKKSGKKLFTQEQQQYEAGEKSIKAALDGIQYIEDGIKEIKVKAGIT